MRDRAGARGPAGASAPVSRQGDSETRKQGDRRKPFPILPVSLPEPPGPPGTRGMARTENARLRVINLSSLTAASLSQSIVTTGGSPVGSTGHAEIGKAAPTSPGATAGAGTGST